MLQAMRGQAFRPKARALQRLLKQSEADSAAYRSMMRQCDSLLYANDTPYHSDSLYVVALRHRLSSRWLSPQEKQVPALRLRQLESNRAGHPAADFSLRLRNGRQSRLSQMAGNNATLLILFDPSCRRCQRFVAALGLDDRLGTLLADGELNIVCVDVDPDGPMWERIKNDFPPTWSAGFAESGTILSDYDVRTFPSVYLLDRRLRVILHSDNIDNLLENALKQLPKNHRLHQKH